MATSKSEVSKFISECEMINFKLCQDRGLHFNIVRLRPSVSNEVKDQRAIFSRKRCVYRFIFDKPVAKACAVSANSITLKQCA